MSEHLEPKVGAILQFIDGEDLPANVVGYRWRVFIEARRPPPLPQRTYKLRRVDNMLLCLQVTQAVMDRCGRLLMRGEEQAARRVRG